MSLLYYNQGRDISNFNLFELNTALSACQTDIVEVAETLHVQHTLI